VTAEQQSVAFDRVASFYDHTRQLSNEGAKRVSELLSAEIRDRQPVLEIGVGTGRIALPLAETGVSLVGLDLSAPMLEKLVAKAGGHPPFSLVRADATKLPFGDGAFGVAYGVHVLHLIPGWRDVIRELARVVRPGGTVLLDFGGAPEEVDAIEAVSNRFEREAGIARRHPGIDEDDTPLLDEAFAELGARLRLLPEIVEDRRIPIDGWIQLLRGNVFSWTWPLDDETRERAADATLEWAKQQYGDLSEPEEFSQIAQWRAYDLP
jgi:ubiquinone/menaquinone biosynthesis C-methylase UbiE